MASDERVYMAKLAQRAERYDDMVNAMNKVVQTDGDLSSEERNLLSIAYKNAVGIRRASWRVLNTLETHESFSDSEDLVRKYKSEVENELKTLCHDVISLIDRSLMPNASSPEAKLFHQKMKGDYYRYIAEISKDKDRKVSVEQSLNSYRYATETAHAHFPAINPARLGLALNFSVFYYEIMNSTDRACKIAKAAFDDAMVQLDSITDETYKDATLMLQLIRDNLTLWKSEEK